MKAVCLDTNILAFAVQIRDKVQDKDKVTRARHLLKTLEKEGSNIIIPAVVAAEFVWGLNEEQTEKANEFFKGHRVAPFDMSAVKYFQKIIAEKPIPERSRNELKVDYMVLAIALAQKADCLYTHDNQLKTFASNFISTEDLPEVFQRHLPSMEDDLN